MGPPSLPRPDATGSARRAGGGALVALVAWSLYVWATRIVNATGDETASAASRTFSVVLSLTFVVLAVGGAVVAVRAWSRPLRKPEAMVLRAFSAWTIAVWAVRVPLIVIDDRSVAFEVVHAVLGLISIVLAALVWRSTGGRPARRAPHEQSRPTVSPQ